MNLTPIIFFRKRFLLLFMLALSFASFSQNQTTNAKPPSDFWNHVQFGGGIGLSFGNGYTDIGIAPSAIYNVNEVLALGAGLQFSYVSSKYYYDNFVYGVNALVLVNPIPQIQISIGLNESRVNYNFDTVGNTSSYSDNYWATSMTIGAGYRSGNVTFGIGYNILNNDPYYDNDPFFPFVRAYF